MLIVIETWKGTAYFEEMIRKVKKMKGSDWRMEIHWPGDKPGNGMKTTRRQILQWLRGFIKHGAPAIKPTFSNLKMQ